MNAGVEFTGRYLKMMFKGLRDATPEQVQQELEHCRRDNLRPVRAPRLFRTYFKEEPYEATNGHVIQVFRRDNHSRKLVFYLHGGATIYQPVFFHWRFLHDIGLRTKADLIMPIYPKSPDYHTSFSVSVVLDFLHSLLQTRRYDEIHLMGDSAGACMAMVAAQEVHQRGWQAHTTLTLLSPCLDLTYTHENEMRALQHLDPMLQFDRIKQITEVWRGELPASHPWVSPIFGDLRCLHNTSVYYGTNELLKVDVDILQEALEKQGLQAKFHEYEGMFHTFPLFPVPQGFEALKEMASTIIAVRERPSSIS